MKTRKTGASICSTRSEFQPQGADASPASREARVDLLCELLEQREQALAMARLLSARILEILSLPVVRTISRPGEEPEEVFRNSRATYFAVILMRVQRQLWETVLAPLPPELAVEAMLAAKSRSEAHDAARTQGEATSGRVQRSNTTKNILENLSLPAVRTISRPGEEPEVVFRNSRALYLAIRLVRIYSQLWETVLAPLDPELAVEAMPAATSRGEANDSARNVAHNATAGPVRRSNATKCNVLQRNSAPYDAKEAMGDRSAEARARGERKEREEKAA